MWYLSSISSIISTDTKSIVFPMEDKFIINMGLQMHSLSETQNLLFEMVMSYHGWRKQCNVHVGDQLRPSIEKKKKKIED